MQLMKGNKRAQTNSSSTATSAIQYTFAYVSPLGEITLASDGQALAGLWFSKAKYFGSTLNPNHTQKELPIFRQTAQWLDCYFDGNIPDFTPPLSLIGSPFRLEVWDILLQIPYGQTVTYGDIGAMLARKNGTGTMSAQAVGGAVGHNPISLIVPCHRVIGRNGSLTGYAGGVERKEQLLKLENII